MLETLFNQPDGDPPTSASDHRAFSLEITLLKTPALWVAVLATTVSLGIATNIGWQRGGTLIERTINVAFAGITVLGVHLLPMCWRNLSVVSRIASFGIWCVGLGVVMYGQASFVILSQQHAGNQRAASVPVAVMRMHADLPRSRGLTEIAGDIAKVSAKQAHIEFYECHERCTVLDIRKATLSAQLAALNIEADEAKRREVAEDRFVAQVERDNALRDSLRADPVVTQVATWLGTTASRVALSLAVASAVALEGFAIKGWLLVSVALSHDSDRVQSGCATLPSGDLSHDPTAVAATTQGATEPPIDDFVQNLSEEDRQLEQLQAAVRAGRLKATQKGIRDHLGCGQDRAGYLNRLYRDRFVNTVA